MVGRLSPTVARFQLGRELRQLREVAGLSLRAAAGEIDVSVPTLSKIEGGRQAVRPIYLKLHAQRYGVAADDGIRLAELARQANRPEWFVELAKHVPDWFRLYLGYEGAASRVRTYGAELVDDLLQTPAYARAVVSASRPDVTASDMGGSLALRRGRRDRVIDQDPTSLHVIMNEAVVRRVVGGPTVMREQLAQLVDVSTGAGVTLQVLPFSVGAHPAMAAPFTLLDFDANVDMNTCHLSSGRGALYLDGHADLVRYEWMFTHLADLALPPDGSRSLMAEVMDAL
jgi:transcriptional regulator with XRE-family HTH domain